jgi:3-isopropylmalate/(R)-2-methylmalate dehydratase small subunit
MHTMEPFALLTSRVVALPFDDIDTDQIIPARFLKTTDKRGLGAHLFADWRIRPGFPLLEQEAEGAQILLAGYNFGCGSSREHAPWALVDWGFRAIVARSFADIFKQNATKNGLVPVALSDTECRRIEDARKADPKLALRVRPRPRRAQRHRVPPHRRRAQSRPETRTASRLGEGARLPSRRHGVLLCR